MDVPSRLLQGLDEQITSKAKLILNTITHRKLLNSHLRFSQKFDLCLAFSTLPPCVLHAVFGLNNNVKLVGSGSRPCSFQTF